MTWQSHPSEVAGKERLWGNKGPWLSGQTYNGCERSGSESGVENYRAILPNDDYCRNCSHSYKNVTGTWEKTMELAMEGTCVNKKEDNKNYP